MGTRVVVVTVGTVVVGVLIGGSSNRAPMAPPMARASIPATITESNTRCRLRRTIPRSYQPRGSWLDALGPSKIHVRSPTGTRTGPDRLETACKQATTRG